MDDDIFFLNTTGFLFSAVSCSDKENAAEIRLNTNVLTEMQVLELIASLEGTHDISSEYT
jgi:hypothetical protein